MSPPTGCVLPHCSLWTFLSDGRYPQDGEGGRGRRGCGMAATPAPQSLSLGSTGRPGVGEARPRQCWLSDHVLPGFQLARNNIHGSTPAGLPRSPQNLSSRFPPQGLCTCHSSLPPEHSDLALHLADISQSLSSHPRKSPIPRSHQAR